MVLAVDAGGTHFRASVRKEGVEIAYKEIASDQMDLVLFIESVLQLYPKVEKIGVAFAGQVKEGVILSAPNLEIQEREIQKVIQERYGIALEIDNDLNCAVLAERAYWGSDNIVTLFCGTGLGCGVLEEGRVVRGISNLATEIGHVPFRKAPFRCGCGKDNCLELYASGSGLAKWLAYEGVEMEVDLKALRTSLEDKANQIAFDFDEALVYAAATVVTLFNPQILVLGGGVIEQNPDLITLVQAKIEQYAMPAATKGLWVEISQLKNASLEGAALLVQ